MKKVSAVFKEGPAFLEDAPIPCLLMDRKGYVITAGQAAAAILSRDGSSLPGRNITELFEDTTDLFSRLRARRTDRRSSPCEADIMLPDGQRHPVTVRLQPYRPDKSGPLFVAWLDDRSEVQKLKDRLVRSEKLSAMAIVAGKVAHEIRSPLNAIFLNNDLLQEKVEKLRGEQGRNLRRYIVILQEEVERLDEVVRSYLSLSRLAGGDREPTGLDQFLGEYIDEMRAAYTRFGIEFVTAFRAGGRRLSLNRRQFRRVLRNLFANSRDAMKDGGVITVSTEERAGACCITVSDTGEGIVPEVLSGLATPFTSHKTNGTGLGLYLVREIIEQHGGRFDIRSIRGEGTSVIVTLPFPATRKPS